MMNIIDIRKSFGKKQVLKGCSFQATDGECIGIIGANGSGKSTLLSIIAGMRKADSGHIDTISDKSKIAYVPQENPLFPELSVRDNLMLWYGGSTSSIHDVIASDVIQMLKLNDIMNQKVKTLSGGTKKRLSIAMAMAGNPSIIILDEPGAALDLPSKALIKNYLTTLLHRGCIIILATHDELELSLCHKLYVLGDGVLHQIPRHTSSDELLKVISEYNAN
ncbi:MAG: ABC transporter ATP-binding protein [Lachnospiraceae bacterium]|nr:ABC transporter ATP-binding protein [Lachnospiraceae bacterium]